MSIIELCFARAVNFGTPVVPLDRVLGSHVDQDGHVALLRDGEYRKIVEENWWWLSLATAAVSLLLV